MHVVENRTEERRLDAPLQQIEGLHERHARLEQRGQLLVEDEELARRNALRLRQLERQAADRALLLQGQDEQALLLELVAQPCLAVGGIDALDDLSVWRGEPAPEFHGISSFLCNWLSQRTLSARKYSKTRKVCCRLRRLDAGEKLGRRKEFIGCYRPTRRSTRVT